MATGARSRRGVPVDFNFFGENVHSRTLVRPPLRQRWPPRRISPVEWFADLREPRCLERAESSGDAPRGGATGHPGAPQPGQDRETTALVQPRLRDLEPSFREPMEDRAEFVLHNASLEGGTSLEPPG